MSPVPAPPARYISGEILLNGRDVLKMSQAELCDIRGGVVSYVFQEPGASLNPVFRVGAQIKESLKLHKPDKATDAEVIRLLKLVGSTRCPGIIRHSEGSSYRPPNPAVKVKECVSVAAVFVVSP